MCNHRIFKKTVNDNKYYCLKEAFYDDSGEVHSWTEDTLTGYFEDLQSLIDTHELMLKDIKKYSSTDMILDEDQMEKDIESSKKN